MHRCNHLRAENRQKITNNLSMQGYNFLRCFDNISAAPSELMANLQTLLLTTEAKMLHVPHES